MSHANRDPARPAVAARLTDVHRSFGQVRALEGADLVLRRGEVHGLLGANGAGKSTLLGVLGGMLRPDRGSVEIDGRAVTLDSPREAWAHGVSVVHQHFTLVPALTVLENLALGRRLGSGARIETARHEEIARTAMKRTGLSVPLDVTVADLGVGDRQRVEILKALLREPEVLVLDEPTAVLAPPEIATLFTLLRALADEGRAVVLVAHKLDEVRAVADTVTVLRAGRTVLTSPLAEVGPGALVTAMVGSEFDSEASAPLLGASVGSRSAEETEAASEPRSGSALGEVVASLEAVGVSPRRGGSGSLTGARDLGSGAGPELRDVTLAVHRGEVVGVAGVEGNGQHPLALVLAGRVRPTDGVATLPSGIGFVPQDRSTEGLIGDFDLVENVALALHADPAYTRGALLRWDALAERAESIRSEYGVRAPSVRARIRELSGGNRQRVLVGRELGSAHDLLVVENPTRGLDVEAARFVHERLLELRASSAPPGIVLISTDLDEVLALSDRIYAMRAGRLIEVPEGERTLEGVGSRMLDEVDGE